MNLYGRLIRILCLALFARKRQVLDESGVWFRVWPTDCDINFHLTNGRYLSLMDLGRTLLLAEYHALWKVIRRRWLPVIGRVRLDFVKPLNPFVRFRLRTRLVAWDEKWFYLEQTFERGDEVHARACLRALFIGPRGKVPTIEILKLGGFDHETSPPLLQDW